jgi:metal-responsive CopG/Arc/MetJ family transcriptional regulator
MGNKLKVTVTIEESIVREIDRASNERGESRSRVIEKAMQQWRERELDKQLIEGYLAMAKEDAETAEANLAAGAEALT